MTGDRWESPCEVRRKENLSQSKDRMQERKRPCPLMRGKYQAPSLRSEGDAVERSRHVAWCSSSLQVGRMKEDWKFSESE